MPGSNREFVDADDLGAGAAGPVELLLHVPLVEVLDGVPVEVPVLGNILHCSDATGAIDPDGEALSEMRVVGQPVEVFAFHGLALATEDASDRKLQVDAATIAIEVTDRSRGSIVEGSIAEAADATAWFFRRRWRAMTTA